MKDKLSYSQLYNELETLNTSAYDCFFNGDFEGFQNTIDEFAGSGIMEQEEFAIAREAYRYSSMSFTFDGIWISVDSRNPLDRVVMDVAGPSIKELHERDVMPVYAYMVRQAEPQEINYEDSKIAGKRCAALQHYKDLYTDLYKDPSSTGNLWSIPLVADAEKHKMVYINRITELAAARSKFYATYDFTSLPLNGMKIIDNEKLRNLDPAEKNKYLTGTLDNIYDHTKSKNKLLYTDCFSFNGYKKILVSNYPEVMITYDKLRKTDFFHKKTLQMPVYQHLQGFSCSYSNRPVKKFTYPSALPLPQQSSLPSSPDPHRSRNERTS